MRICVKNGHRTAPKFPGLFLTLWGFLCLSSFSYLEDLPRPKEREEKKARDWCRISRCWKCLNKQTHRHASWHCRQSPESPPFINPDMNEPKCGCIWSVWDALAMKQKHPYSSYSISWGCCLCPWAIKICLAYISISGFYYPYSICYKIKIRYQ